MKAKFILAVLVIFCLIISISIAEDTKPFDKDYQYVINQDNSISIIACNSSEALIVVPESYMEHPISDISNDAFAELDTVQSVVLPYGIKSIGDNAFRGCANLSNINIPESVVSIGENAFEGCENMLAQINVNSFAYKYFLENDLQYQYYFDPIDKAETDSQKEAQESPGIVEDILEEVIIGEPEQLDIQEEPFVSEELPEQEQIEPSPEPEISIAP